MTANKLINTGAMELQASAAGFVHFDDGKLTSPANNRVDIFYTTGDKSSAIIHFFNRDERYQPVGTPDEVIKTI